MAGYVFFGLLLLFSPAFGVENLLNIINYLHNTYGMENNQYALGINVPAHFCDQNAPLDQNFLSEEEDANEVKKAMSERDKRIYIGKQLIGARPKFIKVNNNALRSKRSKGKGTWKGKKTFKKNKLEMNAAKNRKKYSNKKVPKKSEAIHAEYLLLRNPNPSHMQNLLNKPVGNCTVFLTVNSPCVNRCSNGKSTDSIIPGLEIFRNWNGPKAFVFRQVYDPDTSEKWQRNLPVVDQRIPVYRCTATDCIRCITSDGVVDPKCTAK